MRALSVKQPWAELIARGKKKIEYRTWSVDLRGDLLIVASKSRNDEDVRDEGFAPDDLVYGRAVCVVELVEVEGEPGDYEWKLRNPRRVAPIPVTGYASLYTVPDSDVRFTPDASPAPKRRGATREPVPPRRRRRSRDEERPPVVLVADHDEGRRARFVRMVIDTLDAAPLVAQTSREALAQTRQFDPDVLVIPGRMPRQSGFEVALELRRGTSIPRPRVIVLADPAPDAFGDVVDACVGPDVAPGKFARTLQSVLAKAQTDTSKRRGAE